MHSFAAFLCPDYLWLAFDFVNMQATPIATKVEDLSFEEATSTEPSYIPPVKSECGEILAPPRAL